MATIPIFTSLPPAINRRNPRGEEVGSDYALRCVNSWQDSGFEPVTVNSRQEPPSTIAGEVRRVLVDRNAASVAGKPLIFLKDLLSAARTLPEGPFAITNADIILEIDIATKTSIQDLRPGTFIAAKRVDIERMEHLSGLEYEFGYDFFVFHSRDIAAYTDEHFVFGAPWWDHFLPIFMALRGLTPVSPPTQLAYHLVHEERWDWNIWAQFGQRFLETIGAELTRRSQPDANVDVYSRNLERAVNDAPSFRAKVRSQLRMMREGRKTDALSLALDRTSTANIQFIDTLRS